MAIAVNFKQRNLWLGAGLIGLLAIIATVLLVVLASARPSQTRPFRGTHQAGIIDPAPAQAIIGAFDLVTTSRDELISLLREWTRISELLIAGRSLDTGQAANQNLPALDSGEAMDIRPTGLTMTFGVGASLFDHRFGLSGRRPAALIDLPVFPGDSLQSTWNHGDLVVQVCANDPQVVFHAMRSLARAAQGKAVLRWVQAGFIPGAGEGKPGQTPRNLQGFKDGTVNPDPSNAAVQDEWVWAKAEDGSAWMDGGSYLVVRRIRMFIEVWDRSSLGDQEQTIGRSRLEGAPLGAKAEKDEPDFQAGTAEGEPVIPDNAHIRLARGEGKEKILRRGFSYVNGLDPLTGQWDAGLLFAGWQRDPRTQFLPIQQRLASDALNEYIKTVGSAVFACFPGVGIGEYLGQGLFADPPGQK